MKALFQGPLSVGISRSVHRAMVLIGISVLAHAIVLHWAAGNPSFAWPAAASNPVIVADIVQPPPAATPTPAPAKPRPAPKRKPHHIPAHASLPPHAAPLPVSPQEKRISSLAVAGPEEASSEPAKTPSDAKTEAPVANQPAITPAEEKAPSASIPAYKFVSPPSVDLHYDVTKTSAKGGSISGRGKISWRREDGKYVITGEVYWLFITALKFSSEGMLGDDGISPVLYSQKSFRRSATNTHFQHERNVVSFSASENSYPRTGGEQDRASVIWQLAGIGRADEGQFASGKEFEIMVAGVRDEEPWQLHVIGKEAIAIGIGGVEAWHLVRTPKPGSYDQTIDIWLSPSHEWYPVKLRYTEPNGDHLDLDLSKLNTVTSN